MAAEVEPILKLPRNDTALPDAVAHRCPAAIIIYHGNERSDPDRAAVVAESSAALAQVLERIGASSEHGAASAGATASPADHGLADITEEDPGRFEASVRRIHEYLRAGDVFQVNISRPWTGRFRSSPDPWSLYGSLRRANPAPFAGLMRWGRQLLLSSSRERLNEIDHTGLHFHSLSLPLYRWNECSGSYQTLRIQGPGRRSSPGSSRLL